jgi:hypothetical protein
MAECEWAILCDYAFLDVNRKTCIIGAFDKIFTPAVPSVLHQSALAMKFVGQPGTPISFRIEAIRPTGAQLIRFEATVQMGDTGSAEMQINIAGLSLPDHGVYAFNVYEGDELRKTITFLVTQPPAAQPPTP